METSTSDRRPAPATIAYQSAVKAWAVFSQGALRRVLIGSHHCSRYNQNTGRLLPEMFEAVFARAPELRRARYITVN